MTTSELSVETADSDEHQHSWQLVSVESDYGVEVRERVCTGCSAVLIDG